MKRTRKDRGATRTRDPTVIVTVDSGSHINARHQARASSHVAWMALLSDESVVFTMRSEPHPHDTVLNVHTERPVMQPGADRPELAYALEVQRRMMRIGAEKFVVLVSNITHLTR